MTNNLSEIASKSLGDSTSYAVYTDQFDPSLLNPMPRASAREGWGINPDLIGGFDRWNCHEATFLLNSGQPIAGTLSFVYGAHSEFMIESKSMKLYLNSFDMCRMGQNVKDAINLYVGQIQTDLSACLQTPVRAHFHWIVERSFEARVRPLGGSQSLDALNLSDVEFTDFTGKENHVETLDITPINNTFAWHTNALRSRCRHTKQKDTGTASIIYQGNYSISPVSIFKQIVSLREVNEFHEFCAEKILVEIGKHVAPFDNLSVALFYARRGSLDINPVRWIAGSSLANRRYDDIYDPANYLEKTQGQ